jgi:ketosteroid isomerase-like protein
VGKAEIQVLREGYAAASRGDWADAFREVDADFELKTADRVPVPGTIRGPDAIRAFLQDLLGPFDQVEAEPQEFFERGDQIVVFLLVRLRPRGSSAMVENRIAHVWTLRDGRFVHFEIFPEREKALEAVGLPAAAEPS